MGTIKNFFTHLDVVHNHRKIVKQWAFKMGIWDLGIKHDLSKYSIKEFGIYKFATGKKSPHETARELTGSSESWIYHKNSNPHHWEYWVTFNNAGTVPTAQKIPYQYIIEMLCDMISTGKVYLGKDWTCSSPLEYYNNNCLGKRVMHEESEQLLLTLLESLSLLNDEKLFFYWYNLNKKELKKTYEGLE